MKRLCGLVLLVAILGSTSDAKAQRRGRGGPAMTPYGPVANPTQSPEWRQAGGNPMIYQQLIEQKMMVAQQKAMQQQYQAMQKQQQAYEKWVKEQKAKKDKGQPVDLAYQQMLDQKAQVEAAVEARAAKLAALREKKKRGTKKGTTKSDTVKATTTEAKK